MAGALPERSVDLEVPRQGPGTVETRSKTRRDIIDTRQLSPRVTCITCGDRIDAQSADLPFISAILAQGTARLTTLSTFADDRGFRLNLQLRQRDAARELATAVAETALQMLTNAPYVSLLETRAQWGLSGHSA